MSISYKMIKKETDLDDIIVLEKRWIVIDKDTGKILDDCSGKGYKSKTKAISSYKYKHGKKAETVS